MLKHRDEFGQFLTGMGLFGEGAEIGVAACDFAKNTLDHWKGHTYHMIDPWETQEHEDYKELTNEKGDWEAWANEAERVAKAYSGFTKVAIYRATSRQAVGSFVDNQLDWCYLDGAHDYVNVWHDLNAWWPKVKPGGVFAGHDYLNRIDRGWWCQVEEAVHAWCYDKGLAYTVLPCTSWVILK